MNSTIMVIQSKKQLCWLIEYKGYIHNDAVQVSSAKGCIPDIIVVVFYSSVLHYYINNLTSTKPTDLFIHFSYY